MSNDLDRQTKPKSSTIQLSVAVEELLGKYCYLPLKPLGHGYTSYVWMVKKIRENFTVQYAAKIIELDRIKDNIKKFCLTNELMVMRETDHSNIIKMYDLIQTDQYLIMIMELGLVSLSDWLKIHDKPELPIVKDLFRDIALGLAYLHQKGISHCDIKPANVVLFSPYFGPLTAKITDFTFSKVSINENTGAIIRDCYHGGTEPYRAPETYQQIYDPFSADCFSMGVMLYQMITTEFPFGLGPCMHTNVTIARRIKKIRKKRWPVTTIIGKTPELHNLLRQLLNPDPFERITAKQILVQDWIKNLNVKPVRSKRKCLIV